MPRLLLSAVATIGAALLASCGGGADEPGRPELQAVLDGLVTGADRLAPGAAAFVAGPRGTWLGAAGIANLATGEPMRPEARVRLESVGKVYTAALVVRLEQEGRLGLGDTVERWLPGVLPDGHRITLRHLLTMRSGLVDNNDLIRDLPASLARVGDPVLRRRLVALAERIEADPALEFSPRWWIRLVAWQPLLFPPGTGVHYSNTGYELLGLIAARAARAPLAGLYRERIFAPLGLRDTAYDPRGPIAGPHARGYAIDEGRATDATDVHPGVGAEGGIVADADDTAAFLTGLMRGRLVDRARVAGLRLGDLWLGGEASGCAGRAYGWSGGGSGYKTNVWVSGDGRRVAVLLLNGRHTGAGQAAADRAAAAAMARLYCSA